MELLFTCASEVMRLSRHCKTDSLSESLFEAQTTTRISYRRETELQTI